MADNKDKKIGEKQPKKMSKGMIALIAAVVIAACGVGGWREGYTRYRG